jgi:hypothetical protein
MLIELKSLNRFQATGLVPKDAGSSCIGTAELDVTMAWMCRLGSFATDVHWQEPRKAE